MLSDDALDIPARWSCELVRKMSMGVRVELAPHLLRLMSLEDQQRYGGQLNLVTTTAVSQLNPDRSPKRDADEKKQQGEFASWLSLQNSKGRKIPFCWHTTHTRSKATPGTPDFWVGINGRGIWFEFKRDDTCKLTTEQEEFRSACEVQRIEHHVVYSSQQAIDIVEQAATVRATVC
jgi:hypothetical protein